jgi:SAM-dependent methyltransferase
MTGGDPDGEADQRQRDCSMDNRPNRWFREHGHCSYACSCDGLSPWNPVAQYIVCKQIYESDVMNNGNARIAARPLILFLVVIAAAHALISQHKLVAQDKSVRPGINKPFENPNVKDFIGAFERDGREPFDRRQQIVEACKIRPGMAVADIGTGTGLFARLFSPLVGTAGRVYAVDTAEKFVKHVEATAKEKGLANIVGVVCRPDSVNLPPNSIDLAFISDTYHHFEFPYKTIQSIHRALRPGGQVVLIDFRREPGKASNWVMKHVRAGQDVFSREITESGFRQIEERPELLKESYFVRFEKMAARQKAGAQER